MGKKNFLLLVSMARPDARLLQDALARLRREADPNATPAWLDASAVGIFMTTHLTAKEITTCVLPGNPSFEQKQSIREVLAVEIGAESWSSSTTTKTAAWLNAHRLPQKLGA